MADGALKAIVGSSAFTSQGIHHEFLRQLAAAVPREKILIAVDSFGGRVAVHGWKETLPLTCAQALPQLEPYCSGFLCTYIDGEGRMQGTEHRLVPQFARRDPAPHYRGGRNHHG